MMQNTLTTKCNTARNIYLKVTELVFSSSLEVVFYLHQSALNLPSTYYTTH